MGHREGRPALIIFTGNPKMFVQRP